MSKQKFEFLFFTKISKSLPSNYDASSIVRGNRVFQPQELIRVDGWVQTVTHFKPRFCTWFEIYERKQEAFWIQNDPQSMKTSKELKYSFKTFADGLSTDGTEHYKRCFILVPIPVVLLTKKSGMEEQLKLEKLLENFRKPEKCEMHAFVPI